MSERFSWIPLQNVLLTLSYSGNPGAQRRILQGCQRETPAPLGFLFDRHKERAQGLEVIDSILERESHEQVNTNVQYRHTNTVYVLYI